MVCRPAKVFIFHSGHPDVCTADGDDNNNNDDDDDHHHQNNRGQTKCSLVVV